ncbi:Gfo/Idh/MocA family protein [Peribacillus frigoritolerans]|uniref:Gfo/Idh/MocA family protein n=1 Tax=Peribacillus frigoritolerans TaxID=450367 RepID=UPI00207A5B69|nr:Gfo/Idh/MocA family oxidoreductase [Peribacillus frigoritolerans]USK72883.1 Gfo/Idh/MocA family oxidoreductase [Peribacillus frigoritolerans]
MSNHLKPILLVGAGNMGMEYAKVLKKIKQPFHVFTRSEKTALHFTKLSGKQASFGDLEKMMSDKSSFDKAIVAVSVEHLKDVALTLMKNGVKEILLEKPGAINVDELKELEVATQTFTSKVYIGYNRRFYESVQKLLSYVTEDKPIRSIHFDFTELSKQIEKSGSTHQLKNNWLLANSSHVIDLAFFIAGKPQVLQSFSTDHLAWHPEAAIFTGSGVTVDDALFSYHANWKSPGRWGIEVMTDQFKFILQPLERLYIIKHNSFEVEEVTLQNHLDTEFKPGLFNQVQAFMTNKRNLVDLSEQIQNVNRIYTLILFGQKH